MVVSSSRHSSVLVGGEAGPLDPPGSVSELDTLTIYLQSNRGACRVRTG